MAKSKRVGSRGGRPKKGASRASRGRKNEHDKRNKSAGNRKSRATKRPDSKPRSRGALGRTDVRRKKARGDERQRQRQKDTSREISKLREQVRSQAEIIRELSRSGARGPTVELGDETPRGEPSAPLELPEYIGPTWDEIDWSDFDYDDAYDDVGDEDEDSYSEDA